MKINYRHAKNLWVFLFLVLLITSCKEKEVEKKSSAKKITAFSFALATKVNASIDSVANVISATLPIGTDITKLSPVIEVSALAKVSPASGSVQDFSKPVSYTVTAEDGSTRIYTTKITALKSSEKKLLSFKFSELIPEVSGAITEGSPIMVTVAVPGNIALKALKPTITTSPRATISPASGVVQDFTQKVKYTITAEDGSTSEVYVSVVIDKNTKITAVSSVIWKAGDMVELTGYNFDDSRPIQSNHIFLQRNNEADVDLSVWATNPNLIIIPVSPNLPAGEYTGIWSDIRGASTSAYFFEKKITMLPIVLDPKITSINKTKFKVGETLIVQGNNLRYPDAYSWIRFFELPSLKEVFWPRTTTKEDGSINIAFPQGSVGKKYKIKATIGNVTSPLYDQELEAIP